MRPHRTVVGGVEGGRSEKHDVDGDEDDGDEDDNE